MIVCEVDLRLKQPSISTAQQRFRAKGEGERGGPGKKTGADSGDICMSDF